MVHVVFVHKMPGDERDGNARGLRRESGRAGVVDGHVLRRRGELGRRGLPCAGAVHHKFRITDPAVLCARKLKRMNCTSVASGDASLVVIATLTTEGFPGAGPWFATSMRPNVQSIPSAEDVHGVVLSAAPTIPPAAIGNNIVDGGQPAQIPGQSSPVTDCRVHARPGPSNPVDERSDRQTDISRLRGRDSQDQIRARIHRKARVAEGGCYDDFSPARKG